MDQLIDPVRLANKELTAEQWVILKAELTTAVGRAIIENTAIKLEAMKPDFVDFTDKELAELAALLESDAYRRFKQVVESPKVAQREPKYMWDLTQRLGNAINSVLKSHGLKEVH
ncbi:MAG: hypothetical protein EKK52_13010 [Burkholderiales bacterium]|nr:MAG: hypothetical protein EKK52_13010 [Burkholderiales bacterium]